MKYALSFCAVLMLALPPTVTAQTKTATLQTVSSKENVNKVSDTSVRQAMIPIASFSPLGKKSPLNVNYRGLNAQWQPSRLARTSSPTVQSTIEEPLPEGVECGTISVETEAGSFDQMYVAGTESHAAKLIPGVAYDIDEIQKSGNFKVISHKPRLGVKLYVNEPQGHGLPQVTVRPGANKKVVSVADLNEAVGQIIASAPQNVGAHKTITVESILSEEQLALKVGLGGSYMGSSAQANLDYNTSSSSWWYMVDLVDPYFTISVETAPPGIFPPRVDTERGWGYVRSVTYGRRAMLLIETSEDLSKTSASFEADINGLVSSVDVELEIDMQKALESAKYSVYVYGGSNDLANDLIAAAASADIDNIQQAFSRFLANGGTQPNDAKPLSYELADLDGNTIVAESNVFSREIPKCSPISRNYEVSLTSIEVLSAGDAADTPNFLEIYGRIGIAGYEEDGREVKADEHVIAEENQEKINELLPIAQQYTPDFNEITFAVRDNYIKIEELENKTLDNTSIRTFSMPRYEDDAYFNLYVDATDHDAASKDDEYRRGSLNRIKVKDLIEVNNLRSIVVRDGNDEMKFHFTIKKIY